MPTGMNRNFRLIAALGIASVLTVFMAYTALAGSDVAEPVIEVEELVEQRQIAERETVELVGVAAGPVDRYDGGMNFSVTGREGENPTVVTYSGSVPDAFRVGRHVVVKGSLEGDTFVAKRNSLVTKCPSKFEGATDDSAAAA